MKYEDRINIRTTLNAAYILGVCWFLAFLLFMLLTGPGCAALQSITPADRASAYAREAQGISALCKAYAFDRASGLVGEVPEMAQACGANK